MAVNKLLILLELCAKLEHSGADAVDFAVAMAQLGEMHLSPAIASAMHEAMGLPGNPGSHRVVVAMSGGVNSSVVAVALKLLGYDVVGITLQLYDHGEAMQRKGACCAGQDIHDARRVSARFDIPHYVLDFESRFRNAVIDRFVDGYLAGETPVPCVACNQTVKFADLLGHAKSLGASVLATGHYIESRASREGSARRNLFTPADTARDQSYFLFGTTQEQVDFLRFPLGGIAKPVVRQLAEEMGLVVAAKPDSQDICFVPNGRYADVILKLRPDAADPGDIVDMDGNVLGRHDGIVHYTIGQRKGLGIAGGEPLYVIKLDAARKRVIVGPREALRQMQVKLSSLNWLGDEMTAAPLSVYARIRSSRAPVEAVLTRDGDGATVTLTEGEFGVSPGQACVLYDGAGAGARVLGGGYIARPN